MAQPSATLGKPHFWNLFDVVMYITVLIFVFKM